MRLWGALAIIPLALVLSSCRTTTTSEAPAPDVSAFPAGLEAKEAPMLAALVKAGKLPPLKDRLPEDPQVVKPVERLGTYGGTWRWVYDYPDVAGIKMAVGYTPLVRWKPDSNGVEPGLAKSWEYTDGGRTLTLHLRKGVKWSDGAPYTSADFKYWYDLCNGKTKHALPGWCLVDGKPMKVETPDPYTIVMRFNGPNCIAHLQLAVGFWAAEEYNMPKHYMMQFDPKYNPKYKDYVVFDKKDITDRNPDRPSMWPWRLVSNEGGGVKVTFERNPYFYMVDPKGRQLPYIDRVVSTLETDPQVRALRMLNGEVDAEWRLLDVDDLSLYMKGQKSGNYKIKFWPQGIGSRSAVLPNWDARDPVLRKLIRDKRFRRALSYAIPRKEINLTVWRGLGVPQNAVVSAEAWHFQSPEGRRIYEEWRRVYSEFDPDKSNRLLDDIGLKRDKKGRRLRPDGKPLTLIVQAYPARMWAHEADEVALFADVWTKRLGIKTYVTTPPVPEIYRRLNSGDFEIGMWDESEMDLFTMPDWVFPTSNSYWHPLTGKWYQTGGKQGWPPTGSMKDLVDIFDRIKSEPDIEKCHKLVYEAIRIHINEGPFSLGTVGQLPALVLVKNNFHNVPDRGGVVGPWPMAQPGASHSEQFFIEGAQ